MADKKNLSSKNSLFKSKSDSLRSELKPSKNVDEKTSLINDDDDAYGYGGYAHSDGENMVRMFSSPDEFDENIRFSGKTALTGRQRRKQVARIKGGEFQAKRKKRRVYFCCICSEIDIQKLYEHLIGSKLVGWAYRLYGDVLRMYRPGAGDSDTLSSNFIPKSRGEDTDLNDGLITEENSIEKSAAHDVSADWSPGAQEIFVFEFGSAVFWGFTRGEESNFLKTIRLFCVKGLVDATEFQAGEDDMAFVTSPTVESISIGNDVITIPDGSHAKEVIFILYTYY